MEKIICADVRDVYVPTYISDSKLWHGDYGVQLLIKGLDLPTGTQVHFSLTEKSGEPIPMVGVDNDGALLVDVPDNILREHKNNADYKLYAFIYSTTEVSGWTEHEIVIPVGMRPDLEFRESEDVEAGAFDLILEEIKEQAKFAETSAYVSRSNADYAAKKAQEAESSAEEVREKTKYVKEAYENISYDRNQIQKNTEDIEKLKESGGGGSGSNYVLPQATSDILGGVKASKKTNNETVEAKIGENGKLYVPKYPETLPASDVYSWAKQKNKPEYNASEVGALPENTKIPSKTSEIENDSGYVTEEKINKKFDAFGGTVEVTEENNAKERTVLLVNPGSEEINIYSAEEVNVLLGKKLDSSKLAEAINETLEQAKESGQFNGENGKTPVKGTDYFTESDKDELIASVISRLPVYGGEVSEI